MGDEQASDPCEAQNRHVGAGAGSHSVIAAITGAAASSHESRQAQVQTSFPQTTTPPEDDDAVFQIGYAGGHDIAGQGHATAAQELVRGSHAAGSSVTRTRRHHALSALRTVFHDRMSVNPAHEIEENLRFASTPDLRVLTSSRGTAARPRWTDESPVERAEPQSAVELVRYAMANMDGALPENDGMQSLRYKLQEIKMLAVSTEEKAKRMHNLMTRDYQAHKESTLLPPSPKSIGGGSETDGSISPMLGAAAMPIDPKNPYNLRPGDLDIVLTPLPKAPRDVDGDADEAMIDDEPELGCMHYKRNVKVQCFDCQRWFPCRHCHDQAKDLPFPHSLNRKKTQNMLCMLCQTPQPAAETCMNCEQYAAWYYCSKCKLWDNDSNKRIYHCDDCGICRVGEGLGKDFVHCKRCNVCISIATSAAHPCIERATDGDCPLCLMHMFEARVPVVSLPCGHYMHGDCYKDLMAVTYKCPVCSKSAVNMELQWRKLDDEIAAQPMPDDDDLEGLLPPIESTPQPPEQEQLEEASDVPPPRRPRQVWVGCNDCGARTWTNFHWLGLKCGRCDSYNTNQMAPTAFHETEAERLLRQEQQIHRQHDFTGNAALRDAGIGIVDNPETEQYAPNALEVPESPSAQPQLSSSPRLAAGAQSPGRYFVTNEEIRRPSFSGRFSAPSMPNLPTLSSLSADMPRMPRMPNLPNLPNLQNMRQNFPNMPNMPHVGFSPYEMIDAVSRSLSPMRYYLRGLDAQDLDDEDLAAVPVGLRQRPTSVQSDSAIRRGSKLRTSSDVSAGNDSFDLFETDEDIDALNDDDSDSIRARSETVEDESSGEESAGETSDAEMVDGEPDGRDFEIFGHR